MHLLLSPPVTTMRPWACGVIALSLSGCPSPMEPPPPEEPMIAAPEAPRIPWLAAGTPDITPPQIPWLTDESACPEGWGWTEVAPGVNGCDPYPSGRIEDCGPTGAHFPGEAGCRDLDSGDTEWPSDLPATNVLYVREGASGGDGSRALPLGTLPEALALATEGTTIALAPGRYDTGQGEERLPGVYETLSNVLVDGIHIRGTSVARTTLFSARPAPPADGGDVGMLTVRARDVVVSDLRFESPHPPVDAIGGSILVSRVVLDGTFLGLFGSEGCAAVFEDVIARNTTGAVLIGAVGVANVTLRRAVLDGTGTYGVAALRAGASLIAEDVGVSAYAVAAGAWDGATLQFSRLGVHDPTNAALTATSGAHVTGRWLLMELGPDSSGGLAPFDGGIVNVEDVVGRATPSDSGFINPSRAGEITVSRAVLAGRYCAIGDSTIDASDVVCVNPDSLGLGGRGGATVRISRADISVSRGALWAETRAHVTATDVRIHDLPGDGSAAYAIDGATLSLERTRIERASVGIHAGNAGHVSASDVSMRDLRATNADIGALGFLAASSVTASRVLISGVEGYGVFVAEEGDLEVTDLVLHDLGGPPGRSAGLVVTGDAHGAFRRVDIDGSAEQGAVLLGPAEIEDLTVQEVSASVDGELGFGVVVGTALGGVPPSVTAHRVAVRDVDAIGLVVAGAEPGAIPGRLSLGLTDVRVEGVRMAALGGGGVIAQGDADVSIDGFVVRDTANVGIASSMGARTVLSRGLIVSADVCTSSDAPLDLTTVQSDQCGPSAMTTAP